jgi:hypothetical protein
MIEEEEIYRQKYLKYKKKYLTALENMTGGAYVSIQKNSTIYFCLEETYNRLKKSDRENGLIKGIIGGDNCFIERLSMPLMSLVLSKSTLGNWELKTIDGKECKFPNYPFLCGRKLGILFEKKEVKGENKSFFSKFSSDEPKIIELPFNASLALKQIQEFQPFILKKLNEINNIDSGTVYYLHTYGNIVSFNDILEYKAFPTTLQYSENSNVLTNEEQQGGGGAKYYICNNAAAQAIEKHYKNIILVDNKYQAIVTDCLDDIALDSLSQIESQFGMLDELATVIYVRKTTTRTNTKLERKSLPNSMVFGQKTEPGKQVEKKPFDEKIAFNQFDDIINNGLDWAKEKNPLQYPISIYKLTTSFGKTGNIKTLTRIDKKELNLKIN